MYTIQVVTPFEIIEASGQIETDAVSVEPEPTTLWARRRVTQVILSLGTRDRQESGALSTHPELTPCPQRGLGFGRLRYLFRKTVRSGLTMSGWFPA